MNTARKRCSSLRQFCRVLSKCVRVRGCKIDILDDATISLQPLIPFLNERRELENEIAQLKDTNFSMVEAFGASTDSLSTSSSIVFDSWTKLQVKLLQERLSIISDEIDKACQETGVDLINIGPFIK